MTMPLACDTALSLPEVVASTGLSADVLRAWQRRYGFPQPFRGRNGWRTFPADQVAKLRLLRKLVDLGVRPAQIVALPPADLEVRLANVGGMAEQFSRGLDADVAAAMDCMEDRCADALLDHLSRCLARRGARDFVLNVAMPLVSETGAAWHGGRIAIHQEHLVTEILTRLLGNAALDARRNTMASEAAPTILMTTSPGEAHGMGLAMLEVLLVHEGCRCVHLGLQTPPLEIAKAAAWHRAAAVALSFSSFFKPSKVLPAILEQRKALMPDIALWVGGACSGLAAPMPQGVTRFAALEQAVAVAARLRTTLSLAQ